ncbi:MAG: galactosyltransferase-related protein [Phormidesmis sp.]
MAIRLDIILPVKNRDTLLTVVKTILSEMAAAKNSMLGQLLVCDGGSTEATCLQQLETVSELPNVRVLHCGHSGDAQLSNAQSSDEQLSNERSSAFNKSWLMNKGLAAATAEVVVISDVDILWGAAVLDEVAFSAANYAQRIYSILNIKESDPTARAVRRQRYTYRIAPRETDTLVEICADTVGGETRPGCGIVCAQRQVLAHVGGYKTCFVGWGWEDQDFLIRAQLLGYEVVALGEVIHLSHGDERRCRVADSIEESRDQNIMRCLAGLQKGELLGDLDRAHGALKNALGERISEHRISVLYPPELAPLLPSPQAG